MSEMLSLITSELAPRFALSAAQCEKLARYHEMLLDWNTRMNLTAITEPAEVLEKHFWDSLLLLEDVDFAPGETLIDVGTGAGFPGMVLAIARPALHVTLLDSLAKRVGFLDAVAAELALKNVQAVHDRAELFAKRPENRDHYDWACARAVARLPLLAEYCLPFVREGGHFIAMKGPEGAAELAEAARALEELEAVHAHTFTHTLPHSGARDILLIKKIGATPKKFPRKPGAAAKSPLI